MELIQQILGNVDQKIIIAAIVILVILFIVSLIKKMIKLAIFIAILIAINTCVMPTIKEYQEQYNFRIENSVAMMTIDGRDISIDKETCEGIKFNGKSEDSNNYSVSILVDGEEIVIEVPKFIQSGIESFANKSNIAVQK